MLRIQMSVVDVSALPKRGPWWDRVAEEVMDAGFRYRDHHTGPAGCLLLLTDIQLHTGAPGNSVATRDDDRTP